MRFLACLLFALATSSFAASIAERSPFTQGLWWDPSRSGHGFHIFNAADQAMVVWYTYDERGSPVWYTAQGDLASVGTSWPLLKHRWANGRKADPTQVGTLKFAPQNPEGATLAWVIGSKTGSWSIQPFLVSGVLNEVDHSGLWFDPTNSGWGFSLLEQGDVLGGILFGYDANGEATWAAGFDRTPGRAELWSYTGPCPSCTYRAPTTMGVGHLTFDFRGEAELVLGSNLGLLAPGTNLDGARIFQLGRPASTRAADNQLASFTGDSSLKTYLDGGMVNIPPMSIPTPPSSISAAPPSAPATAFSATNLQEAGVDEADLVKTNGRHVYTFATDANATRKPTVRIAEVLANGAGLAVRGSVALASGADTPTSTAGLYLDGTNLVSVAGGQAVAYGAVWAAPAAWVRGSTFVEVMDASVADAPVTRWRAQIEGYPVSSRRIGQRLYVVSRFVPSIPGFVFSTNPQTVTANQQILAATPLSAMLPKVRINNGEPTPLLGATEVFIPPQGPRPGVGDLIVVTAIDLATPRIAQSLAIAGGVEGIYVSTDNLFIATMRYQARSGLGTILPVQSYVVLTDIHQIALGASAMTLVGSGVVEGYLGTNLEQVAFRMSDYKGRLRVVSSNTNGGWGAASNRLTVLQPSTQAAGLLKTVSYIPSARRPETLGKPYESLHATRFLEDRLYAVTFKQIDPLYVVDLADANDPKIAGQLELPGFSDYLHPLPNGLLLGFGKDTRPTTTAGDGQFAWYQGLQLTLFDVSDAGQPRAIQSAVYGKRGSNSPLLTDHHAFSIVANADGSMSMAFPAIIHDGTPSYYGGDSTYYPWQASGLMRVDLRFPTPNTAQLVQSVPNLITNTISNPPSPSYADPAAFGRSILFPQGAAYIGNGKFWWQNSQGAVTGPL